MLNDVWTRKLVVALGFAWAGCDPRELLNQSPPPPPPVAHERQSTPPPVGRYQVVNPTPEFARNTMLLDTVTGETWLICSITGKDAKPIEGTQSTGWCVMSQALGRGEP